MEKKGTSVFSNSLIWFGAGVSIAEIPYRNLFCTAWIWQGNGSDSAGTSDRRADDVCSRNDRWKRKEERHGDRKDELR